MGEKNNMVYMHDGKEFILKKEKKNLSTWEMNLEDIVLSEASQAL